jgi:hypothetical protein
MLVRLATAKLYYRKFTVEYIKDGILLMPVL